MASHAAGVLVSELLAGRPAWEDLPTHAGIMAAVLGGRRPPLPPQTSPQLAAVLGSCQLETPRERPPFSRIVEELDKCAPLAAPQHT